MAAKMTERCLSLLFKQVKEENCHLKSQSPCWHKDTSESHKCHNMSVEQSTITETVS